MKPLLKQACPPLLPVFACLAAGIFLAVHLPDLPESKGLSLLIFVSGAVALAAVFSPAVAVTACLAGLLGMGHMAAVLRPERALPKIASFADNRDVTITGHVASFAEPGLRKTRYVLSCQTLKPSGSAPTPVRVSGRIYLSVYSREAGQTDPLLYGTSVRVSTRLRPVRNFANPGGFDYVRFLRFKGIGASGWARPDGIQVLTDTARDPPWVPMIRNLQRARQRCHGFIVSQAASYDKKERAHAAAVLSAMVLGLKQGLPRKVKDNFARAGISHILSISGLHLSIIGFLSYFLVLQCFRPLPGFVSRGLARKTALALTLFPLSLYAVVAGFSPATQRALVMAAVFVIAMALERETDPLNTLCLAGVLILGADPPALYSISFQLSFAAVAGIIIGMTWVSGNRLLPGNPVLRSFAAAFWVSLFAGAATFPLTALYFNTASFVFVLSNLILVPVMGMVCLPGGMVAAGLSFVFPGFAGGLLNLVLEILSLCLRMIDVLADLPLAWTRMVTPGWLEVGGYYLLATGVLAFLYRRKRTGGVLVTLAAAVLVFTTASALKDRFYPGQLEVTVLDVGQGASALVHTPEGKIILIDCGGFYARDGFDVGRYVAGPFLWRHWIRTIDLLILSHPQSDHMNGLAFILENFKVRRWVRNRDLPDAGNLSRLITIAEKRGVEIISPSPPFSQIQLGQVMISLYPPGPFRSGDLNHNSLVCQLEFEAFAMLFTGDIDALRETQLSAEPLSSRVMTAPHHGSRNASSKIFLDQVNPESVIVSCGYWNRYGFPHSESLDRYRQRGMTVYRTDTHGAVIFKTKGIGYQITTCRNP